MQLLKSCKLWSDEHEIDTFSPHSLIGSIVRDWRFGGGMRGRSGAAGVLSSAWILVLPLTCSMIGARR
jgi:hypothetical protein